MAEWEAGYRSGLTTWESGYPGGTDRIFTGEKEESKMAKLRLVFATGNADKLREFKEMLDEEEFEIMTMTEAGVDVEIVEDGKTFEENARIKTRAVASRIPDSIVVADDSGLVVDALGGEPGVYSSRYLGEDTSYEIKNAKIIERLAKVPQERRTARFVCAMDVILPNGEEHTVTGVMEGYIGEEPMGENGFGYDPIFYVEPQNVSTAYLSPEEKNAISHRGKALRAVKEIVENYNAFH